jgi:hypothetical protein
MKRLVIILPVLVIFSCRGPVKDKPEKEHAASAILPVDENKSDSSIPADEEKVLIIAEPGDTLEYSKQEFDALRKAMPGLNKHFVSHPDALYDKNEFFKYTDEKGKAAAISFACESCKDAFYEIYAHFLKQKNGVEKYASRREKLIEILRNINEICRALKGGGTYFGHQYRRIHGYAEYAIYKYSKTNNNDVNSNFKEEQKKLYFKSLKEKINGYFQGHDSGELTKDEKSRLKDDLAGIINNLNKLVTDNFYLENLQEFQRSYY